MKKLMIAFSFIVLSCQFSKEKKPSEDLESSKYGYRLGDMVKDEIFRSKPDGRLHHYKNFPNSIAVEYMKLTNKNDDLKVLIDILNRREKLTTDLPSSDLLVIHLRIGDVIDDSPESVDQFLRETVNYKNGYNYVKPLSFYEKIISLIKIYPIKKITLVCGFHLPSQSREKSYDYVDRIKKFFEKHGYTVILRIDGEADPDFIYMTNAQYFIPSGGGFSKIIKDLVIQKGGKIIEP